MSISKKDGDLLSIFVYKKGSANALNPDITKKATYKLCL